MYCSGCGHLNDDQARFCSRCGAALQAVSQEPGFQQGMVTTAGVLYAGFWRRLGAALIDGILLTIVYYLLLAFFVFAFYEAWEEPSDAAYAASFVLFFVLNIALQWIYYAAMESSSKQATLGKMALGIIVTDLEGKRISYWKATGRYFGKIISTLILYIGFIMIPFTEKKQGLHDILAGCLVVKR